MINQKTKIRILAVLLVLALVSAGAAPARTACAETCCCSGAECHEQGPDRMAENVHGISLSDKIPGFFYPGDRTGADALPRHSNSDCREGLTKSPCNMDDSSNAFEALQGTPPAPSRNERCQDIALTPDFHSPSLEHHLTSGLLAEQKMSARAAPVPIFLQTLSFLI